MGTGSYFGDVKTPRVMVQVGEPGDSGVLEIVEMLFTVKGATAGAILMEWNVHESTQGSGKPLRPDASATSIFTRTDKL